MQEFKVLEIQTRLGISGRNSSHSMNKVRTEGSMAVWSWWFRCCLWSGLHRAVVTAGPGRLFERALDLCCHAIDTSRRRLITLARVNKAEFLSNSVDSHLDMALLTLYPMSANFKVIRSWCVFLNER